MNIQIDNQLDNHSNNRLNIPLNNNNILDIINYNNWNTKMDTIDTMMDMIEHNEMCQYNLCNYVEKHGGIEYILSKCEGEPLFTPKEYYEFIKKRNDYNKCMKFSCYYCNDEPNC